MNDVFPDVFALAYEPTPNLLVGRWRAALATHAEAKQLELQLEKLYEQRNALVAVYVPLNQRGSKALQGNLGKARLRKMGDYGFTVDDSPPAKK